MLISERYPRQRHAEERNGGTYLDYSGVHQSISSMQVLRDQQSKAVDYLLSRRVYNGLTNISPSSQLWMCTRAGSADQPWWRLFLVLTEIGISTFAVIVIGITPLSRVLVSQGCRGEKTWSNSIFTVIQNVIRSTIVVFEDRRKWPAAVIRSNELLFTGVVSGSIYSPHARVYIRQWLAMSDRQLPCKISWPTETCRTVRRTRCHDCRSCCQYYHVSYQNIIIQ